MKKIVLFFLFVVLAVQVVALPCDFAWNTDFTANRCLDQTVGPRQHGGITAVAYSAVSNRFSMDINGNHAGLGNAPELPLYTTAYYTVSGGSGDASCTATVGTNPPYRWCPVDTITPATYLFSNPSGNKWADVKGVFVSKNQIPVGDFYVNNDNYVAVFMCGCGSQDCRIQQTWNCNPAVASQKGVNAGRWIVMPLPHCANGETRSVGCDVNGLGCTAAEFCNNGQWQAMTVSP